MITVVDYGLGNVGSMLNMLRKLGHDSEATSSPERIIVAERLIFPCVGAFDHGIDNLERLGLLEALTHRVLTDRVPILGVCLGAQLMTRASQEGQRPGLAWVPGTTVRFFSQCEQTLKVPSMGWNEVRVTGPHPLFEGMFPDPRFYFVHSYHFALEDPQDVLAVSTYGYEFASAFAHHNVLGVQFHPEKSHKFGMKLLDNFGRLTSSSLASSVTRAGTR